jgi:hypothetical protein
MSPPELAAYIQSHLLDRGIDVVLSGGAVVAFYTSGKYVSRDLDLVNRFASRRSAIRQAMQDIGFHESGRHFVHPDTPFFVEFPPGPLSVGEDNNITIHDVVLDTGLLRLLSPTDCVKDRLSWYYHFGDLQTLEQAVLVAREQTIDLREIRRWSKAEGKLPQFDAIRRRLGG